MPEKLSFVVPYASAYQPGPHRHAYQFWNLGARLAVESEYPFYAGDAVELVDEDDGSFRVVPCPRERHPRGLPMLAFVASDIPLSPGADFEFVGQGCQVLHHKEAQSEGNATYALAVLVEQPHAVVKGMSRRTAARLTWQIDLE